MSKKTITGEDESKESELKYLQIIRTIRDNDPDTFDKVKRLPKKARTAREYPASNPSLLTYFRKGKLQKFYLADAQASRELDFFSAAKTFEAERYAIRGSIGKDFYKLLEKNKGAFEEATSEELEASAVKGGRDSATALLHILKSAEIRKYKGFTDDDELYIGKVITLLEEGGLPKQTARTLQKVLNRELKEGVNPLKILAVLRTNIAPEFFRDTVAETAAQTAGPREVILSEYLEILPSPLREGRGEGEKSG